MNDLIRKVGRFLKDVSQDSVRASQQSFRQERQDYDDENVRQGFSTAARISLHLIQKKLDAFNKQMEGPGPSLTKSEQGIYAELNKLKSEIEDEFDRSLRGTGIDWRPRAKKIPGIVVVRRQGKSES